MELGSTSLSTSACNGSGNSTLQPRHKTFLSHSGAQKGFVEQLCVDLERLNRPSFFDKRPDCLPRGKHFARLVFEAIDQCEVGVVVLSEEFFTSKWPMLELVAMANVKKRKPSFTIMLVLLGISLPQYHDVDNHERWLSLWHIWAEYDSKIDLKDWANVLQLFGPTNTMKYSFEVGEAKYREDIVEAICWLVPPRTWFEDSHTQGRSPLCKVIHERDYRLKDNIPGGAVYQRPGSSKWEPRIKFPVTRGMGVKSKRVPLGSYDTFAEGEVAYQIAAFYCKKRKHTGQLDLGGGDYFPIPTLSVDPNLPYEEKVKQVGDQVMKVYAEFEERKTSRNPPPSVLGLPFEMPTGEGELLVSSPTQQLRQPFNSRMDSAMQCPGFELGPNTHSRVDFNNLGSLLLSHTETQHELLGAYKQIDCLKAQVSGMEVENMQWEVKYSELEQRNLQLEHENGQLNHQIMQSLLQTQHQEEEFDPDRFLTMANEESLGR